MSGARRVLLLDPTPIGSLCATGQFKATLFKDWPACDILEVTTDIDTGQMMVRTSLDAGAPFIGAEQAVETIKAFAPDFIYLRPELWALSHFDFIVHALPRLSAPAALHIMDDWIHGEAPAQRSAEAALLRVVRYFMRRSSLHMTDGPAYVADFASRFETPFENLLNAVDIAQWTHALPAPADSAFTLTHMGNYDATMSRQALIDIAGAVDALHDEFNPRLDIYVRNYAIEDARRDLRGYRGVRVLEQSSSIEEYIATLRRSDVNLYAYSQDAVSLRYMGKGIPNKTCELLAAGRPILAYAHHEFSGLNYLRVNGAAIVVTDRTALASAIRTLYAERGARNERTEAAARLLRENHDAVTQRARFLDMMRAMQPPRDAGLLGAGADAQRDWDNAVRPLIMARRHAAGRRPSLRAVEDRARSLQWLLDRAGSRLMRLSDQAAAAQRHVQAVSERQRARRDASVPAT